MSDSFTPDIVQSGNGFSSTKKPRSLFFNLSIILFLSVSFYVLYCYFFKTKKQDVQEMQQNEDSEEELVSESSESSDSESE
jgi:amino acid permease